MGLPKHLEKMLAATLEDNSVKSWSIYQEKDKSFTFKIRFQPSDIIPEVDISTTYTRKNEKRQRRDRERAEARTDRITRSQAASQAKAITPDVSSNSIETFLNEDISTPVNSSLFGHDSFEIPDQQSLNPSAEQFYPGNETFRESDDVQETLEGVSR